MNWNEGNHPEIMKHERFFYNIEPIKTLGGMHNGMRVGKVAYDCYGTVVKGLVPVFRKMYREIHAEWKEQVANNLRKGFYPAGINQRERR